MVAFFALLSGVSYLFLMPTFQQLDNQAARAAVNQNLDSFESELMDLHRIANGLVPLLESITLSSNDVLRIMEVNGLDFFAIPKSSEASSQGTGWLLEEEGLRIFGDVSYILRNLLENPLENAPSNHWAFLEDKARDRLFVIANSEKTTQNQMVIVGRRVEAMARPNFIQRADTAISFEAAKAQHGLPIVHPFDERGNMVIDNFTPEKIPFTMSDGNLKTEFVVEVPYLDHGLKLNFERPAYITITGMTQLHKLLITAALVFLALLTLVYTWSIIVVSQPVKKLIHNLMSWNGFQIPAIGDLLKRKDEIGILSNTFILMAEEIRAKTRALEDQAIRDGLTGLYNRRNFDETLAIEWERHQRSNAPLSIIMVDVDHFKAYNDLYGHQEGDDCLRLVAHACDEGISRPGDHPFRYGGEEFSIILADTNEKGAFHVAENIRQSVENIEKVHSGGLNGHVTATLGVASSIGCESAEELIRLADQALYAGKNSGRNCVVCASHLPIDQSSKSESEPKPRINITKKGHSGKLS